MIEVMSRLAPRYERFDGLVDDLDGSALEELLMIHWLARKIFGDKYRTHRWRIRPVRRVRHPFLDGRYLMHLMICNTHSPDVDPAQCKHVYVDHSLDFAAWFGRRMAIDLLQAEAVAVSQAFSAFVLDGAKMDAMLCDPWDAELDGMVPLSQVSDFQQPERRAV